MKRSTAFAVLLLAGCASQPPVPLDDAVQAEPLPDIPKQIQIVEVPKLLPLPNQLKRLPAEGQEGIKEPLDAKSRVARANQEARVIPSQEGYINAIQVWPYADGALYQLFTSPGRVTVIALQEGEELVTVSAGDTVRWIVGDTTSGAGATQRVNILIKPTRSGIRTNLVITTSRRTYLLELTATEKAWMASASWEYPKDRMLALQKQASIADAKAPVAQGLSLEQLRFRYEISGDKPAWRPVRAFDDGEHVYIQFPARIAQGELPPLFVVGPQGDGQLVNYRYRAPYYIVDRLFGTAELRLGGDKAPAVRIARNDLRNNERGGRHDDSHD